MDSRLQGELEWWYSYKKAVTFNQARSKMAGVWELSLVADKSGTETSAVHISPTMWIMGGFEAVGGSKVIIRMDGTIMIARFYNSIWEEYLTQIKISPSPSLYGQLVNRCSA